MKVPTIEPLEARIAPAVLTITAINSSKEEGSTVGGTTGYSFKVTLDAAEPQDVTVLATALDGTAKIVDGDFSAFTQTITIPKGTLEAIFTVPIKQDTAIEADETFSVSLSSPSLNAVIGSGTASATILNDDFPKVSIVALDSILSEGSASGGVTNFRFDVILDRVADADVTVVVNLKDGTAKIADGDFDAFSHTVTIPAGQLKAASPVSIPIKQDTLVEADETFSVELSSPSSNAVLGTASEITKVVTIRNDDPATLSISDATVLEGASGGTSKLQFKVKLSTEASEDVTFDWRTVAQNGAGIATSGVDYNAVGVTSVTIPAGQTEVILEVTVNGDDVDELQETLTVNISNAKMGASNVTISDSIGSGLIRNDDITVSLSGPATVTEGNSPGSNSVSYTINLEHLGVSASSTNGITVELELVNGSAILGSDFSLPATLFVPIAPGATSANFVVPIKVDNVFEADETFEVRIKSVTNGAIGASSTVTTTILNDDAAPVISIGSSNISEGDVTGQTSLTVSLSAAAGRDITFKWSTVDGTAIGGLDFDAVADQLVTIPAGQTSVTLTLNKLGDKAFEKDETFTVVLSDINGATLSPTSGVSTVKLINDDAAPILSIGDVQVFEGEGANPRLGFVVSITNGVTANEPIQFNWIAGLGTATPGVDYSVVSANPATIPAGATSVTLFLDILDDGVNELDETVLATIGNAAFPDATAVTISKSQATGKILNDDLAISIEAVTSPVLEGNTGTSIGKYRISIPSASTHDVSVVVQFDADNSTAKLGTDFSLPGTTTVVIPAGQTSVDFDVTLNGDTEFEPNEVITLKLANPVNAKIGTGSAALTIDDNDDEPKVFIENSSVLEGDNGIVQMTFTVKLTNAASEDVTFDWSTVDDTAIGGVDFSKVVSRQGVIPKGQTSATITVALSGDSVDEADEKFQVVLGNAMLGNSPLVIDDGQATGTILNDDLTVRIAGASLTEGNSGQANMNFVVSVPQASTHEVVVRFEVVAGTATAGDDYVVPMEVEATILPGQTVATISVPVKGDLGHEQNETFFVNLTSSTNAKLGVASATGTILNDDAAPAIYIDDNSFSEGAPGSTPYQFTIRLTALSGQDVTVLVTPTGGTATLGQDFTGEAITVTIPAGTLSKTVTLGNILGDSTYEGDTAANEKFSVVLTNAVGATIQDDTAVGTIINDDAVPKLSIASKSVNEEAGTIEFTISLSEASALPVTFNAKTLDGIGTATTGTDYISKTQNFTIAPGQLTATFTVSITNDSLYESNETFSVELGNAAGATIDVGTAEGTIVNTEAVPTFSVSDVTIFELDSGTKEIEVVVSLSALAGADITFDWSIVTGGSANANGDNDYTGPTPGNITIAAGESSARIKFQIVGDLTDEADEIFDVKVSNVKLGGAGGTTLLTTGNATEDIGTVKILNDDLSLVISDFTLEEGDPATGGGTLPDLFAVFTVTLSAQSSHFVTVNFATQDGSAVSSGNTADFEAKSDTLTFAPGTTQQTILVKINRDQNFDGTDLFTVLLSNSVGAKISDGSATGTITDDDDTRPSISIGANQSRLENADDGVEGATPGKTKFEFVVTLDHASDETVEVSFSTVDGTAKAGLDYTAIANQRVTFAPGETSKTITVEVLDDSIFEADQTFKVVLSDPLHATVGSDSERTGTIKADSDAAPTLKITGQTVLEGNDGERFVSFVVQRAGATDENITFLFETVDGTAVGGTGQGTFDFFAKSETITMLAGETSKTVLVKVKPDSGDEADETFTAQISSPTNATIAVVGDGKAEATLLNDDLTVSLQQGVIQVLEGNSGQADLVFTVSLSAVSGHATEITYTVAGGSASAGSDFLVPATLTIIIPAGQLTGEIRIPVVGDTVAEANETVKVTLTGAKNAELGTTNQDVTGTILNDDASLSISNGHLVEGNNGSAMMEFIVTLDAPFSYPVTVNYATSDDTATSGSDYTAKSGSVTFALGETSQKIFVPILGDTAAEGDENFKVTLSNPSNAQILNGTATGTIQDDESFLTIDDVTIDEGNSGTKTINFTVTRSAGTASAATVRVSTVDGTAISTGPVADFIAKSEVLSFAAGETKKTFSVVVNGDTVFELGTETFQVVLSEVTGATILDGAGVGSITMSADEAPTIQVADASVVEGDNGTKALKFVVSLSAAADADVTFNFATKLAVGIDAANGADFTGVDQSFTIPKGQKSIEITVQVNGDTDDEADETFFGEITNAKMIRPGAQAATSITIADTTATGTILNDDATVSIVQTASVQEGDGTNVLLPIRVNLLDANGNAMSAGRAIDVTFQIANGTAIAGKDYTAPTMMTVTIPAGSSFFDIMVPVTGDTLDEADETFTITVTSVSDAKLGNATATATIVDNDPLPVITVGDVSVAEGSNAVFTVNLGAPSERDVVVKWVTEFVPNSAEPADFAHKGIVQTLVIPAGQTSGTITIAATEDSSDELDETFKLHILPSTENGNVGANGVFATGTILKNDLGKFSIGDASIVEGQGGTTTLTFTVTRDGSHSLPASVSYATADGSAKAGSDYTAANGVLTFAAGESSKTVSITINPDTVSELDEAFFVNLSNAVDGTIADAFAVGKILSDEVTYSVVQVGEEIGEVGEAGKFAIFKIKRSGNSAALAIPGNVFYTTASNPASGAVLATAGTDYTTTSGTLNFPAGEDELEIKVPIFDDEAPEGKETFVFKISNPVNGQLDAATANREVVQSIVDNDEANLPHIVVEGAKLVEGADGATTDMIFKVKLMNSTKTAPLAVGGTVVVTYSTADGTATTGLDYVGANAQTITFAPGETEKEIRISIVGDSTDEPDETFKVQIGGATFQASGAPESEAIGADHLPATPATGTITNDDLTITLDPLTQGAEKSLNNEVTFTARLSSVSSHPVTFKVKTQAGTATLKNNDPLDDLTEDYDFEGIDQVITIPAGATEKTFTVKVKDDSYFEADETFSLLLSDATDSLLGTTSQTYTILNDDAAPTLSIGDATIVEGNSGQKLMVFTVVLSGATRDRVTFNYSTAEGTAKSSGPLMDFIAVSELGGFNASTSSSQTTTISVPILGDNWKEVAENFTVKLSNAKLGSVASGVTIVDDTGTGEILDDGDTTIGVIVNSAKVAEGNTGKTNLNFTIETTAPVEGSALSLLANTRVGSAKGSDFTALVNKELSIPVGQTQATVTVEVTGDSTFESSEFLFLDVTGFDGNVKPVNGSATTATSYGVILNDDVNIINSRQFQYVDTDGDLVTVKFSKGTLRVQTGTTTSDSNHITFNALNALGGHSIQTINLAQDGFAFTGVNISMVAKKQVLVTGEVLGDTKADVGTLSSAVLNQDLFQISSGANLGHIKIPGNLGQLIAGYTLRPAGVASLEVGSFGSDSNQGSVVLGPIGKMVVNGDFMGNLRVIGDVALLPIPGGGVGKIGTLIIKGDLKGGTNEGSGRLTFTGGIGSATIGGIIGGTGKASGTLVSFSDEFNTRIGKLTVLGNIAGGTGVNSGLVESDAIGTLSIGRAASGTSPAVKGNLIGGTGELSGVVVAKNFSSVFINGDIRGGAGSTAGYLSATQKLGSTKITGSVIGAGGTASGLIKAGVMSGTLAIEGSVIGGTGQNSGLVFVEGYTSAVGVVSGSANKITLGKAGVTAGGDLIGGSGQGSGRIETAGGINSFTAHGDIIGGKGASSGALIVNSTLKTAVVKGSIVGGSTDASSTSGGVTSLLGSGFIDTAAIGSITVEGKVKSGENNGTALAKSGGIYSASTIGKLNVHEVEGNEKVPVVISAFQSIGDATFGDVTFLELLAGYANITQEKQRGLMLNADATIASVIVKGTFTASSIAAGVYAGADGKFGTSDDVNNANGGGSNDTIRDQDAISRIASVVLNQVGTAPAGVAANAAYGIVAEHVKSLKVAGSKLPLFSGPSNDGEPIDPVGSKLQIFEI